MVGMRFAVFVSICVLMLVLLTSTIINETRKGTTSLAHRSLSFFLVPNPVPFEPVPRVPSFVARGDASRNETPSATPPISRSKPAIVLLPASQANKGEGDRSGGFSKAKNAKKVGEQLTSRSGGQGGQVQNMTLNASSSSPVSPPSSSFPRGGEQHSTVGGSSRGRNSERAGPPAVQIGKARGGDRYGVREVRWRGNHYIQEGGILPYGVCGSDGDDREPGLDLSIESPIKLRSKSIQWGFTTLAANVWGESDEMGKPTGAKHVQVLLYHQMRGQLCPRMKSRYLHCVLYRGPLTYECRIGGGEWQDAWHRGDRNIADAMVAQEILHCNFTQGRWEEELKDRFTVEIRVKTFVGDPIEDKSAMKVEMCYMQVEKPWPLVVCTEPMYGMHLNSSFWFNHPWQRNNSFSLLDEFVTYHNMQGVKMQVHDHDGSLNISMHRYKGNPAVAYRRGWSMPALNFPWKTPSTQGTAYEAHAGTACMWEHRFRAKWIQLLHAADTFAFADKSNELIADVARNLDPQHVNSVAVPACVPASQEFPGRPPSSLIERFNQFPDMRMCGASRKRYTPMGNPRAFDSTNVHWFTARRDGFNASNAKDSQFAVDEMKYFTVHIMGIGGRSRLDSHKGLQNQRWNEMHQLLKKRLDQFGPLPVTQ
uniref:Membrane-associated protein n=1 Tax=Hemiselmis andersenii TaxID=464988 RepID=A0A6T8LD42_HEMAN